MSWNFSSVVIAAAMSIAPVVLVATTSADAGNLQQASNDPPRVVQVDTGHGYAVALWFTRPIDHARSRLVLVSKAGRRPINARLSSEPNVLYAVVGQVPPGSYELEWTVPCLDGALLSGKLALEIPGPGA